MLHAVASHNNLCEDIFLSKTLKINFVSAVWYIEFSTLVGGGG